MPRLSITGQPREKHTPGFDWYYGDEFIDSLYHATNSSHQAAVDNLSTMAPTEHFVRHCPKKLPVVTNIQTEQSLCPPEKAFLLIRINCIPHTYVT